MKGPTFAERMPACQSHLAPGAQLPVGSRKSRSTPMNELPKHEYGNTLFAGIGEFWKKLKSTQSSAPGASPPLAGSN